jgi:pyruvate ferredoxin oxidoreductase delta subunit
MEAKKPGWKEIPIGGTIVKPGNAVEYKTGDWRSERPVVDKDKCINCLQCWIFCPDSSILVKDEKMAGYDYFHCKGCGICAKICPVQAIEMVAEENAASIPADDQGIRKAGGK